MENFCYNHPHRKAYSICHNCRKDYCEECLDEGKEYYYCNNPDCQKILKKELPNKILSKNVVCTNCDADIEPSEGEVSSGKVHCPKCKSLIDFNINPPKVINRKNYMELLPSLKWFLGLIIIWLPLFLLGFLVVKLDELGITTPPSQGGNDTWHLFLAVFGGIGMAFLFNYGRRPGGFLDLWLDKILKSKNSK